MTDTIVRSYLIALKLLYTGATPVSGQIARLCPLALRVP